MQIVIDIDEGLYEWVHRQIAVDEGWSEIQAIIMDGKPLPKGHWIEHPHEWGDNWQYSQYECSCCHNWAHFDTDYCPNCGVEMSEV